MPESKSIENPKQLIAEARVVIATEVPYACRKYNHGAPPEKVEELSGQILLLLLEHDCRRLKTYDSGKAKLSTWLRRVVRNYVRNHFQKQPSHVPLEDLLESQISAASSQEKELLAKEERVLLGNAIKQLTPHDQQLAYLKLDGVSDQEIAQAMGVKPRSVQQEWSRIGKKLKTIMKKKGGGRQNLCRIERWCKIFSLRRQQFSLKRL